MVDCLLTLLARLRLFSTSSTDVTTLSGTTSIGGAGGGGSTGGGAGTLGDKKLIKSLLPKDYNYYQLTLVAVDQTLDFPLHLLQSISRHQLHDSPNHGLDYS
jgi:hypothetical protein